MTLMTISEFKELPFCSKLRAGTRKNAMGYWPLLRGNAGEVIDIGPKPFTSRSKARTAAVNEWITRANARNNSPNFNPEVSWRIG